MDENEEFLRSTSTIPEFIGDEPASALPPPPPAGTVLPPGADPYRPWKSVNVASYVPVVRWVIKKAYEWAAKQTGEPAWKLEEHELESLDEPLTEAVQKCLYDLRLSRFADNPYVALLVALATLTSVKALAINLSKQIERLERLEEQQRQRQQQEEARKPSQGSTIPFRQSPDRPSPQSQPSTRQASSTASGKTQAYAGGSSAVDYQTAGSLVYSSNEFDWQDE